MRRDLLKRHWEGQFHFTCITSPSKEHRTVPGEIPLAWEFLYGGKRAKKISNFIKEPSSRPTPKITLSVPFMDLSTWPTHRPQYQTLLWTLAPGPQVCRFLHQACLPCRHQHQTHTCTLPVGLITVPEFDNWWKFCPAKASRYRLGEKNQFFRCIVIKARLQRWWKIRDLWNY